jgi:hypothetical protein
VQSDAPPDRFNQLYGVKPDIIFEYRLYLFYVGDPHQRAPIAPILVNLTQEKRLSWPTRAQSL